ncbi:MAG: hypothetical protein KatS3mg087_1866 [Patescibacteria group bacterium]|nr:MAG: hypothetical protein KatS3mg087_1866 [Patescibacteria group bacterium]
MINLLPADYRSSLKYARRNSILLKWLVGLTASLTLLISTVFLGQAYLRMETNRYAKITEQTKQELKEQDFEETLSKVQNISGNLKLIVRVLSKQILFSGLIRQIGAVIPPGVVLADIDLGKVDGGIDLTAKAESYEKATQTQVNLSDPNNKLFDKVDIISVNCQGTDEKYPCTVSLRALFTKNNPYLFINQNRGNR